MSASPAPGKACLRGAPQPPPLAPDLNALLERGAAHDCGVTFLDLHERETHRSWRAIRARARRVAWGLQHLGIRRGDRVALVLRTEPAFLDAFFGTLLAGAVPVPLYPPVRLGRLEEYLAATTRMVRVSGARLVLAGSAVRSLLGDVVAQARPELGCRAVESLARGAAEWESEVDPEDLALVQFSSGSTVDPKPVALTHDAIVAQTASLMAVLRPTPEDALVSWLPLYHDMGLIGCLLGALTYPGPLVLIAPEHFLARPALWLRALSRKRGTVSAAPSFAYAYAAQRVRDEELAGLDLSSWRIALDGAEPVSAEVLRRFAARFEPFGLDRRALMPVYGLSEAALAVTFATPGAGWRSRSLDPAALASQRRVVAGRREVVSVGAPLPGVEVEVRGEGGEVLAERVVGHIVVRGRSLMKGYLGQPAATAGAVRDGWLDTGDLGFVEEGELFVHGRAKDVILVRGANHAPDELEVPLENVSGVRPGCAVAVGFVPGDGGEEALILAERSGPARHDDAVAAAARRAILERTGISPHAVVMLAPGTLPRTSSGKMRRGEALRRYLAGELAAPRRVTALGMAAAVVRSTLSYSRALIWSRGTRPVHAERSGPGGPAESKG